MTKIQFVFNKTRFIWPAIRGSMCEMSFFRVAVCQEILKKFCKQFSDFTYFPDFNVCLQKISINFDKRSVGCVVIDFFKCISKKFAETNYYSTHFVYLLSVMIKNVIAEITRKLDL